MDSENTENLTPDNTPPQKKSIFSNGIFLAGTGLVITALVLMLLWKHSSGFQNMLKGTPTPTDTPPAGTATPKPTDLPTATATQTTIPTITNTPMPRSAYYTSDLFSIDPSAPGMVEGVVILNEDTSVTPSPSFDQPQWYDADTIASQLSATITEDFYATIGNGAAVWQMDVALDTGLYEIYVLDTAYSSAGTLDFSVMLGSQVLTPLLGDTHVDYLTVSDTSHAQIYDMWHSIGVYSLDNNTDLLSVSTSWSAREKSTIVAIDRVMVARLPQSIQDQISLLPLNTPRYVVDDLDADLDASDTVLTRSDQPAWGGDFQVFVNPTSDLNITWEIPDLVVPGLYEIMIWAPQVEGHAEALFRVLVDGTQFQGAMSVDLGNLPGDHWVSIGSWDVSAVTTDPIELAVKMEVAGGTSGEIAVDAIAFIRR